MGFPCGSAGKESACQCRSSRSHGFDPWVGRFPRVGNGNPLQYSCQDNPIEEPDTIHGVTELESQELDN